MKIQVGNYILRSDSFCFWIEKQYQTEKSTKKETDTRRVAGYSSSLDNLYRSFAERKFKDSDAENMKDLVKDLKQTFEDMCEFRKTAVEKDFRLLRKRGKEE